MRQDTGGCPSGDAVLVAASASASTAGSVSPRARMIDPDLKSGLGLAPMRSAQWFEPFNTGYSVPPYARAD